MWLSLAQERGISGNIPSASSWQTHHLIPQAVWKENKTITLGEYYEKVISMGICSAEYG